jgi:hypothetical protein
MKIILRIFLPLFLTLSTLGGAAVVPTPQAGQASQADYLDYYIRAAKYALGKSNYKDTSNFIRLGLQIDPQNESLLALRKSLAAKQASAASSAKNTKEGMKSLSARQDALEADVNSLKDAHHGMQGRLEGLAARQEDLHKEVEDLSAKVDAQTNAIKRILGAIGAVLAVFLFFFLAGRFIRKRKTRMSRTMPGDPEFRPVTFERTSDKASVAHEDDKI